MTRTYSQKRDDFIEFHVTAESHRLHTFYWKFLEGNGPFKKLPEVFKIATTLSHGQGPVKRAFSVNKSLLVQNVATKSLIAQRMVYDHTEFNNVRAEDVEICQTLHRTVKHARQRYSTYLG